MGRVALFLVISHWALIVGAYVMRMRNLTDEMWQKAFNAVFLYPSPVVQLFSVLKAIGTRYDGRFSPMILPFVLFILIKYFCLLRSLITDGVNGVNGTAMFGEIAYLAVSSAYLVYFNYFPG